MKTGPIELQEIVDALTQLGGQAQAKRIKDRVTEMRGGMPAHYGRSHSYRETIQKKIEDHCPESANWSPSNEPVFQRVSRGIYRLSSQAAKQHLSILEEQVTVDILALAEEEGVEGGKTARLIAYFERNPALRTAAISIHGTSCKACGFNFKAMYGEHGENYIEVHHLVPISTLPEPSVISAKDDLTVLCSNCHRMIHRKRDAPLSLSELREVIAKQAPDAPDA
jgi:5-methylcytosine-specific restriction enzyme A